MKAVNAIGPKPSRGQPMSTGEWERTRAWEYRWSPYADHCTGGDIKKFWRLDEDRLADFHIQAQVSEKNWRPTALKMLEKGGEPPDVDYRSMAT
jgi:hypothetical protein